MEVIRRALSEARAALGMDVAWLTQFTGDRLRVWAVEGDGAPFGLSENAVVALEETPCAVLAAGEPRCLIPDGGRAYGATHALGAYVGVPVRTGDGEIYGSLCCAGSESQLDLDERDARLLEALAGVVAGQLEHDHRYHQLLETSRDPVWVTDLEGRTIFANERLADFLGVSREDLAERSGFDFLSPEQAQRGRAALARRSEGVMERYELAFTRSDGTEVPAEVSGAPLTGPGGEVIGTVAVIADLTERKAAERLAEARFRWLADLVDDQVWTAGADGRLDFLNGRVAEYYGPDARLQSSGDWRAHVHPDDRHVLESVAGARRAGSAYAVTVRLRRHDGEYREHLARAFPEPDADGRVARWYSVATDLTEARAQERLAESEAQLREAQRIARLGAFRCELRTGAMTLSDELLDTLGFAPGEFDGTLEGFKARIPAEEHPGIEAQLAAAALEMGAPSFDHHVRTSDGELRLVNARAQFFPDAEGRPAVLAGTIQDVTDQRAAEAAEIARAEAERANQAKSEFLGRMSHELRTPLNAVLGFGQLLQLDPLTEDQEDSVGHILKAGAHLLELIDEVLEISRIEAGAMRLALAPEPLAEVIGEVVDLVAPLAAERSIGFKVDAGSDPGLHVHADRQRLKQVLLNLLSNSIKYNRHAGMVTVRVRPLPGDRVRIVVSDTGEGLRPEQIARIFSPFERLDAGDGAAQGTGLGLALSRSLAEAMHGELTAASEPGYGCDFTLVLDTAAAPAADDAAAAGPDGAVLPLTASRRKVLCIEDNPSNLHLVERVLRPAGLEVIGAPQGRLGLDLARRHAPDVILLDLDLPDLPGEQVLETLASESVTARIPVFICSADATPATVARLREKGARGYLTKPLDVATLLKTMSETTDER